MAHGHILHDCHSCPLAAVPWPSTAFLLNAPSVCTRKAYVCFSGVFLEVRQAWLGGQCLVPAPFHRHCERDAEVRSVAVIAHFFPLAPCSAPRMWRPLAWEPPQPLLLPCVAPPVSGKQW